MRTQTRRNVVRGAVVLGVGGALSACAGGAAGPGGGAAGDGAAGPTAPLKGQIKLSVWGAVYEDELYTAHYIPEIQALHPEIKVEFIRPAGDYRQFLEVAHAGGDAPDVMRQGAGDAGHYVRSNMDIPLDDYLKREKLNREDFYPHHWPHLIYGGKTYGVPQDTNLQGAYVNRPSTGRRASSCRTKATLSSSSSRTPRA